MLYFQLFTTRYTVLQMKNSTRSISAINPVATENTGDKPTQATTRKLHRTLRINTLRCHQKELEHKGGQRQVHDVCTVHTAVAKKAYLETK